MSRLNKSLSMGIFQLWGIAFIPSTTKTDTCM
jgi:hypothetical protein